VEDSVLFVIALGLLLGNAVRVIYVLWKHRRKCHASIWSLVRGAHGWLHAGASSGKDDPVAAHIATYVSVKREADIAKAMLVHTYILCSAVAVIAWNISTRAPRWMSAGQTWLVVIQLLVSSLLAGGLRLKANAAYGVFMLSLSLFIGFAEPEGNAFEQLLLGEGATVVLRILLSLKYYKPWGVAFWNFVYLIASVYACENCIRDSRSKSLFLVYAMWYFVVVILLATWSTNGVKSEARLEAQRAKLHGERSGFRDLMEMVCDVVITLDDKLRLMESASRLSAMVNFRGESSLLGASLQDFMPDEADRQGFEACVSATSGASGDADSTKPRMLHVKLRDSLGNLMQVELFCATIQTILGTSHMVGIREFSDGVPGLAECRPVEPCSNARSRTSPRARTSRTPQHQRSQPGHTRDSEPGSDDDNRSVCSDVSSFRVDQCFPTTRQGLDFALVRIMSRLVLDSGHQLSECCSLHMCLKLLQEAMGRLQNLECQPNFAPKEMLQCRSCGFLNRDGRSGLVGRPRTPRDAVCFACEEALDKRLAHTKDRIAL